MYAYCAWHVLLSCSRTTEIQAVHGDVQAVKGGPVHELLEKVPGAPARHPIIYCSEGGGEEKERERERRQKKLEYDGAHTRGDAVVLLAARCTVGQAQVAHLGSRGACTRQTRKAVGSQAFLFLAMSSPRNFSS